MTSIQTTETPEQTAGSFFVGIDLGGTNTKFGVVSDSGQTLAQLSIPTRVPEGPESASQRIGKAVLDVIDKAGLSVSQVKAVGLASAGTMDIPGGRLMVPANLGPLWNYFPIRDKVSAACGLPVVFANDADAAAYGEYWIGPGAAYESMIMLTLGTGLGCGIIYDNMIISGAHSHGGEYGHTLIDLQPSARVCGCGKSGHLEAYVSATSVIKRMKEAIESGKATSVSSRLAQGAVLDAKLVGDAAAQGDAVSYEIVMDVARYLGVGMINLMHTIDPECILIGGAMTFGKNETELGRAFKAKVKETVAQGAYKVLSENTVIEFAELGGDAGYIGAAGIARAASR